MVDGGWYKRNVQFPVNIKALIGPHLHPPDTLRTHLCILDGRVKLIAPGTPVAVPVTVVVAEQVVAARLFAAADLERLVDRRQQLFLVVRNQAADGR